jgi:hypothetical protein
MRLSVMTNVVGSQSRTVKDQRYRFACTSCARTLDLQSDYGLILSGLGSAAITFAAFAAIRGESGLRWVLGFSFAAFFLNAVLASELIRRWRNPKLPANTPQALRE